MSTARHILSLLALGTSSKEAATLEHSDLSDERFLREALPVARSFSEETRSTVNSCRVSSARLRANPTTAHNATEEAIVARRPNTSIVKAPNGRNSMMFCVMSVTDGR